MKYFCASCKLGYCADCTSHKECTNAKEQFRTKVDESAIRKALAGLSPQDSADLEIENFSKHYEQKRLELKQKLNKLKEYINQVDKLYRDTKTDLYSLTEVLRICKQNEDPRILHAKSWIHEMRFKFDEEFIKTKEGFNKEIMNLFYGLHENDKIIPIEVQSEEYQSYVIVQNVSIPPQFYCHDTTEVIFRPLNKLKMSTIYFGLPLLVKGEGKVNKIEITRHESNQLNIIYSDHINAKLESVAGSQVGELKLFNCKTFEKDYEYVIRVDYEGYQTFMAFSTSLLQTQYTVKSTNTEEGVYKSRIFGFKVQRMGDNN